MAIMYLSKENFTCPKEPITPLETSMKPNINSLVNSVDPDRLASEEVITCDN